MTIKKTIFIFAIVLPCFAIGQGGASFQKTYGRAGYNYGRCAYQTGDGGYIILGNTSALSGSTDIYLIKTDTAGKIKWEKIIGGTEVEWANDFKITPDKGFIIAGYTNRNFTNGYDALLVKTDSTGTVEWEKTFGGAGWDMAYSIAVDKNNNYILAGETFSNSFGNADVYIIKTDAAGDTLWTKHYGGTGSDIAYSVDTTFFSGYLVAGITRKATDTTYDAYLLKIRSNGDTVWTRKYGDTLDDKFYCARQIDDSSYITCGTTQNFGAVNYDPWILKFDTLGIQKWMQLSVNTGNEEFFDIKKSWKNNLVTTGYTSSWGAGVEDIMASTYDNISGFFIEGHNFGGQNCDKTFSINLTSDSCYVCTGTTESFGLGLSNIYFIKTNKSLDVLSAPIHETNISEIKSDLNFSLSVYPNPTAGAFTIKISEPENEGLHLKVTNILGIEILSESFNAHFPKTINIADFPDGIYLIHIFGDNLTLTSGIIKQSF